MPGPRVPGTGGRVNWLVACWLLTVLLSLLQVGGMFGGVAQVLNLLVPAISVNWWVGICLVLTLALLLGGGYSRIEKLAARQDVDGVHVVFNNHCRAQAVKNAEVFGKLLKA